jgi:hypothetical protein
LRDVRDEDNEEPVEKFGDFADRDFYGNIELG